MRDEPSTNGGNGRDARGRFAKGNSGGPGNPHARRAVRLRTLLLEAVTDDDLRAIVRAMVEQTRGGDLAAAREVLNRTIGRPTDPENPDRLDIDEKLLAYELHEANERASGRSQRMGAPPNHVWTKRLGVRALSHPLS